MPFGFCFPKIFLIPVHSCFKFLDVVAGNVLVVFHHLVDNAVGGEFDDTVGYGFDELVVMAGEQDVAFESIQAFNNNLMLPLNSFRLLLKAWMLSKSR